MEQTAERKCIEGLGININLFILFKDKNKVNFKLLFANHSTVPLIAFHTIIIKQKKTPPDAVKSEGSAFEAVTLIDFLTLFNTRRPFPFAVRRVIFAPQLARQPRQFFDVSKC